MRCGTPVLAKGSSNLLAFPELAWSDCEQRKRSKDGKAVMRLFLALGRARHVRGDISVNVERA